MYQRDTEQSYLLGLAAEAGLLAETALADSTRSRYQAAWKRYQEWCNLHCVSASDPSAKLICLFLTERSKTVGVSALTQDLSAIRHHFNLAGSEIKDDRELLRRFLKGCRRTKKHVQRRKLKIQPDTLFRALSLLPRNLKGVRDRALLLTAFASAMRRSEVVCLQWENIRFAEDGFLISTGWTKSGHPINGCFVPRVSSPLCAWSAMRDFKAELSDEHGLCFPKIVMQKATKKHISDRYLYRLVKRLMGELGAPMEDYGAHSLRRGFISAAHHAGVTNGDIMRVTHHRSEHALLPYIDGVDGSAYKQVVEGLALRCDEDEREV